MNKERIWPRAVGAVSIVALVLVTNEGYRHLRGLVDNVAQSKHDIAQLQREINVLQVQLDNRPAVQTAAAAVAPALSASSAGYSFPPLPPPLGVTSLSEPPARLRPKPQQSDEPKSLLNVALMADDKSSTVATVGAAGKPAEKAKMDVQLLGESK